jgi:hypothetical protein
MYDDIGAPGDGEMTRVVWHVDVVTACGDNGVAEWGERQARGQPAMNDRTVNGGPPR